MAHLRFEICKPGQIIPRSILLDDTFASLQRLLVAPFLKIEVHHQCFPLNTVLKIGAHFQVSSRPGNPMKLKIEIRSEEIELRQRPQLLDGAEDSSVHGIELGKVPSEGCTLKQEIDKLYRFLSVDGGGQCIAFQRGNFFLNPIPFDLKISPFLHPVLRRSSPRDSRASESR